MLDNLKQINGFKEINRQIIRLLKRLQEIHDEDAFITAKLERLIEKKMQMTRELQVETEETL